MVHLILFIYLRTFVAKFLFWDLRTFSAYFFVTEKQTQQTFTLLECMHGKKSSGLVSQVWLNQKFNWLQPLHTVHSPIMLNICHPVDISMKEIQL